MTLISDFNIANENPLSDSGKFTQLSLVSGSGALKVVSNTCRGNVDSTINDASYQVAPFSADQWAQYKLTTIPSSGRYIRLYLRLSGTSGFAAGSFTGYMMQYENGSPNGCRIFKCNGATLTQIAQTSGAGLGNGAIIGFAAIGSSIEAYFNGLCVCQVVDTTYTSGGYVGLGVGDTTAVLDDFSAGDFVAGTEYSIDSVDSSGDTGAFNVANKKLITTPGTAFDFSTSISAASTGIFYGYTQGEPGAVGTSLGAFRLIIAAYGGVSNNEYSVALQLSRLNSSNVVQAQSYSSQPTGITNTSGFGTTYKFMINDPALGAWSSGDRLRADIKLTNNALAGRTVHVQLLGSNTRLFVPWAQSSPSAFVPRIMAY